MKQVTLEYEVNSVPRYGYGRPPHAQLHELIGRNRGVYQAYLTRFLEYSQDFLSVPLNVVSEHSVEPYWNNGYLPGLDAISLHAFLCLHRPKRFLEVGSGNSTRFARRAIRLHGLDTQIVSIDPQPRAEIDGICDHIYRVPLEDIDLHVFDDLAAGDFLFIDDSHVTFMNSDVSVFFLDVLPRLREGVFVHVHDIFLPNDYPPAWIDRFYSEQYLLACYLLAGDRLRIELPNAFIGDDPQLAAILAPLWEHPNMQGVQRTGGSFWVRTS